MPILDIEIVGERITEPKLAQQLATAAALALKTGEARVWVKVRYLPLSDYAENGISDLKVRPVFVTLRASRDFTIEERADASLRLAHDFSKVIERPQVNIHIIFEESLKGRIAFGGQLRR